MPLGSGVSNRWYRYRRFNPVSEEVPNTCESIKLIKNEIQDFNAFHGSWVYEVTEFTAEKLRYRASDLHEEA